MGPTPTLMYIVLAVVITLIAAGAFIGWRIQRQPHASGYYGTSEGAIAGVVGSFIIGGFILISSFISATSTPLTDANRNTEVLSYELVRNGSGAWYTSSTDGSGLTYITWLQLDPETGEITSETLRDHDVTLTTAGDQKPHVEMTVESAKPGATVAAWELNGRVVSRTYTLSYPQAEPTTEPTSPSAEHSDTDLTELMNP